MIDIKHFRQDPKQYKDTSANKGVVVDIEKISALDATLVALKQELDSQRTQKNIIADQKASSEEGKLVKEKIKALEDEIRLLEPQLERALLDIPNPTRPDVTIGVDESQNDIIKTVGQPTQFDFTPKDYMELGEKLDVIDVERAAKVSGPRFGYIKNELVLLEFALIQYVMDVTVKKNKFIPMVTPDLVKEEAMEAMGYLEHGGAEETYHFKEDGLFFTGTSEQAIGPYHMDEVLDAQKLPLRYVGFSTCFRREAGAAGKDTRGILRVHQFDKLEMFIFCKPEDSDNEHELLLHIEEELMQGLELPYHVLRLCSGDTGKPSARTYDIETWLPSQQRYRETHSSSNCTDFQARRLKTRYKDPITGKNEFVHTLNGTAFAIGRILLMILENYQQADGSVVVPEVLQPYCGIDRIALKS